MSTAACWEAAANQLPPEISRALDETGDPFLAKLELVAAVPEWEVDLPGGDRPSQTDVLAVTSNALGLAILGVEAKVDEPFGPTLGEKRLTISRGQQERLDYLHSELQLTAPLPDEVRYQLLHRAVSALLTARTFHAATAVMLVQSFSERGLWKDDFEIFANCLGATGLTHSVYRIDAFEAPAFYLAWVAGDRKFASVDIPSGF